MTYISVSSDQAFKCIQLNKICDRCTRKYHLSEVEVSGFMTAELIIHFLSILLLLAQDYLYQRSAIGDRYLVTSDPHKCWQVYQYLRICSSKLLKIRWKPCYLYCTVHMCMIYTVYRIFITSNDANILSNNSRRSVSTIDLVGLHIRLCHSVATY